MTRNLTRQEATDFAVSALRARHKSNVLTCRAIRRASGLRKQAEREAHARNGGAKAEALRLVLVWLRTGQWPVFRGRPWWMLDAFRQALRESMVCIGESDGHVLARQLEALERERVDYAEWHRKKQQRKR